MRYTYTNIEYSNMVYAIAQCDNAAQAVRLYRERYPDQQHPSSRTMWHAVQNLRDYGSFRRWNEGTGIKTRVDVEEEILNYVEKHPGTSTRMLATLFNTSNSTVWKILKQDVPDPRLLSDDDQASRMEFCKWLLEDRRHILFTDEYTFSSLGMQNIHNQHKRSPKNIQAVQVQNNQHQFELNVWAGMINNTIIGPYFISHLNGAEYLNFLENNFDNIVDEVPLVFRRGMYFQHDGIPKHFTENVQNFLNRQLGDRWISQNGPHVYWPARSLDLTPLHFYLWSNVSSLVYGEKSETIQELREKIEVAFDTCKARAKNFVISDNINRRARLCIDRKGANFEHILKYV